MSLTTQIVKKTATIEKRLEGMNRVEIQKRNQHALSHAVSTMLLMPGLRGLWPCAPAGVSGELIDVQGLGNHLALNGNPTFDYTGVVPYVAYDGTGDYHNITDAASSNAFDILGTETYVAADKRGLTCWAWIRPEETATVEAVIAKDAGAGTRAYILYLDAGDRFIFRISDDGTNTDQAQSAAVSMASWVFVVGRFDPSTTVEVNVNGVNVSQATARASIFDTASQFAIGAQSTGASPFQGRVSLAGIAAAYLSDDLCNLMYQQTRALVEVL